MGLGKRIYFFFGWWLWAGGTFGYGQGSVLAQGNWLRIGVTQTGVHRLDAAALIRAGFPADLDPRRLRLYGNGGGLLPQPNAAPRPNGLTENAIFVAGEADGRLDAADYLLFYAQGPHMLWYDSVANALRYDRHYAADTAHYFLTLGADAGRRIAERPSVAANVTLTAFDEYLHHEIEESNVVNSGRTWYGEYLGVTNEKSTEFRVPGWVPATPLSLTAAAMGGAPQETRFTFSLNGSAVGTLTAPGIAPWSYARKGTDLRETFVVNAPPNAPPDDRWRVAFRYDRANQLSAQGYLDYVGLGLRRTLRLYGAQTRFRAIASRQYPAVTYRLTDAPARVRVWDVTDRTRPVQQVLNRADNAVTFGVQVPPAGLGEFVAFADETALPVPASLTPLSRQDLRGLTTPRLLIITAPAFRAAAERLAAHRRQYDSLRVAVVTTPEVFNEFSSGQTDPTALRDFIRYLDRRTPGTLRYLLLLGDATYDYRNRRNLNEGAGYVPTYESRESLDPIYSYSSDDYFGFLADNEGDWEETFYGDHRLAIGIGRLPVKTLAEAQGVVDKLIRYDAPQARGPWRTRLSFVADDGDFNLHQIQADALAQDLLRSQPAFRVDKFWTDAFPRVPTEQGARVPALNAALHRTIQEGTLLLNYTGHGGEAGWAEEQILTRGDVLGWRNRWQMPLLMTATCEFGRYDNPGVVSGAELALLNPRGGAIGLLTTARPVFASTNERVNQALMNSLRPALATGRPTRLGDLFRETKNNSLAGPINRNFTLLGDPSMRLALPEDRLRVTSARGRPVTGTDTLKAGEVVVLAGEISSPTPFSGTLTLRVEGPERTLFTRGQQGQRMSYFSRTDTWHEGRVTVTNGRFEASFLVPVRADSTPGQGLVRLYALRGDSLREAAGAWTFALRGRGVPPAAQPLVLRAWLDEEAFQDGATVTPTPVLGGQLRAGRALDWGPGAVVGTLNDTLTLDLTPYLSPVVDDIRTGTLRYPFARLPAGRHALRLRARDADGTVQEVLLHFLVEENTNAGRLNVVSGPNPFREKTQFWFAHDLAGDDAAIDLEIYTLQGQLIQKISTIAYQMPSPFDELFWEGTTLSKQALPRGFYFYRIFVRSLTAPRQRTGSGKLFYAP
jgi:hypothetical protein